MQMKLTALESRALAQLEEKKESLFSLLQTLVRFDTQNFGNDGKEAACAEFIRQL